MKGPSGSHTGPRGNAPAGRTNVKARGAGARRSSQGPERRGRGEAEGCTRGASIGATGSGRGKNNPGGPAATCAGPRDEGTAGGGGGCPFGRADEFGQKPGPGGVRRSIFRDAAETRPATKGKHQGRCPDPRSWEQARNSQPVQGDNSRAEPAHAAGEGIDLVTAGPIPAQIQQDGGARPNPALANRQPNGFPGPEQCPLAHRRSAACRISG